MGEVKPVIVGWVCWVGKARVLSYVITTSQYWSVGGGRGSGAGCGWGAGVSDLGISNNMLSFH